MGGSTLVFIVVLVVIPLVLAIGMALPFIADRDTARAFSPSRQLDRTPPHPAGVVRSSRIPDDRAEVRARPYADRNPDSFGIIRILLPNDRRDRGPDTVKRAD